MRAGSRRCELWFQPTNRPAPKTVIQKNPASPPNVINPPENITDSPHNITNPPIYRTNRPFYITRTKPHLPKRNRANRPILNSFWLSRFYNFCRCTNAISPTQIEITGSNALPTNKFDKIANIAPSQNCSTWNNLGFPGRRRPRPAHPAQSSGNSMRVLKRTESHISFPIPRSRFPVPSSSLPIYWKGKVFDERSATFRFRGTGPTHAGHERSRACSRETAGSFIPDWNSRSKSGRAVRRPAPAPLPGSSAAHRLAFQPRTAALLRAPRRPAHSSAQRHAAYFCSAAARSQPVFAGCRAHALSSGQSAIRSKHAAAL